MTQKLSLQFCCRALATLALLFMVSARYQTTHAQNLEEFKAPEDILRFALVIGVQNYDELELVPNAIADAEAAAYTFTQVGFKVRLLRNPMEDQIWTELEDLALRTAMVNEPTVFVIYFAGHGYQDSGFTYIAPRDAKKSDPLELGLPIVDIIARFAKAGRGGLAIFFMDACRNDISSDRPGDGIGRTTNGAIFSFATQSGYSTRSAARSGDSNSPYVAALTTNIPYKGLRLPIALQNIRDDVAYLTQQRQFPDTSGLPPYGFRFMPTSGQRKQEELTWLATLDTKSRRCVLKYINLYPDSLFVKSALRLLTELPNSDSGGILCPEGD